MDQAHKNGAFSIASLFIINNKGFIALLLIANLLKIILERIVFTINRCHLFTFSSRFTKMMLPFQLKTIVILIASLTGLATLNSFAQTTANTNTNTNTGNTKKPTSTIASSSPVNTTAPVVLSSPVAISASSSPEANNNLSVPMGTGPGFHSPNSPFKPLPDRSDVIAWPVLTSVKTKLVKGRIIPNYGETQSSLHKTTQRVQGYMMPLDAGKKQTHFILSSVPLTCQFCIPGGPESMVEVKAKTPVAYSTNAVVVEGQFLVLENDPYGLYYRVIDAVGVK